jgi:methylase of polypeptide subunit release factors
LRPGGSLLVEIGPDQADAVLALFKQNGLRADASDGMWRDLAGRARVVAGRA